MTYPYAVKHNGVYYSAGADVPADKEPEKNIEPKSENVSEETEDTARPRNRRK